MSEDTCCHHGLRLRDGCWECEGFKWAELVNTKLRAAVLAEREACAKVAEEFGCNATAKSSLSTSMDGYPAPCGLDLAAAIRTRGCEPAPAPSPDGVRLAVEALKFARRFAGRLESSPSGLALCQRLDDALVALRGGT